ncbi:7999_t:CDS:2, partial [Funneliformis geosporum]
GLDDTLRGLQGFLKELRDKFHRSYIDLLTLNRQFTTVYGQSERPRQRVDQTIPAISWIYQKVSGPTIANRFADLEHTNSICLPIGIKRLQLTLHMLDESDKFYGKQLRLPYQEDATSSGDIRDNTLDSDLIPPERTKKVRTKLLANNPEKLPSRLFLHFESIQFKPDEENVDIEEVNSDNFLDNILQMTSFAYQQFTATYQKR